MTYSVEMLNIHKSFGGVQANNDVTFDLKTGEVHALIGENGAGKSTVMSILFGLYKPDSGSIKVHGKEVDIKSPNDANELGIGMVHQHFKLIHNKSVTENIILGAEPKKSFGRIDLVKSRAEVMELSKKYGLEVDPDAQIEAISVGMQQRVEILKILYRKADILIFDEPTAVLTPQEITELLKVIKNLKDEGKSIVIITHKLSEIKAVADRCTILRKGCVIGTYEIDQITEDEIAERMIGRKIKAMCERRDHAIDDVVCEMKNIRVKDEKQHDMISGLNLKMKRGEIVGIAGIDGNGQSELVEAIAGIRPIEDGQLIMHEKDITKASIRERNECGIGYIPADRHKFGLALDFNLGENIILKNYMKSPYSSNKVFNPSEIANHSKKLIKQFDIRCMKSDQTNVRSMSGGNQQKIIIAREIEENPKLLIAFQPTRGLDVGAIEYIHNQLMSTRNSGGSVLLVSFELDELLKLSDRIVVMYEGKIVGQVLPHETTEQELGLMMVGQPAGGSNE